MKTATRMLMIGSLLAAAGCSGDTGDGSSAATDVPPGATIDPNTGLPIDPNAGAVDPNTGMPLDPNTGMPLDPNTGMPVTDPTAPADTTMMPGGEGDPPVDPELMPDDPDVVPEGEPLACADGVPSTSQVRRMRNAQYDAVVRDLLGVTEVNGAPPSESLNTDYDGPIDPFTWNAYQDVAAQIAADVVAGANRSMFMSCDPAAEATCYEDTIRSFGRLAFRRPLAEEEVTSFMRLTEIEPAGTPDEITEALLYAFLVSPSFIMLPEMGGTADGNGAIPLNSHEVAARLSFTLWGTIPDADLNAAADAGMLQTPEQIQAQVTRMLGVTDKLGNQIAMAHRAYMVMDEASHWWKIEHSEAFPEFGENLYPLLRAELDEFFKDVAFSGGTFNDLLTSTAVFVNQDNAAIYGMEPAGYGADFVKEDIANRPGFLTRAGFLSSFASPEQTSPILRGAFITVQLLGVPVGAPDPTVIGTAIPDGEYFTRRQQIEALTTPEPCNGCHTPLVNPPGYVLENYDAIGRWQDVDPLTDDMVQGAIDPTADVIFTNTPITISGPEQLMTEITNTLKARQLYGQRVVAFYTGRTPNETDNCIVNNWIDNAGGSVLATISHVTQADSFRLRTVGN